MTSPEQIIHQTQNWIKAFIINYNICPFARQPFIQNKIHYSVNCSNSLEQCLDSVFAECQYLDKSANVDTTFLIYPNNFFEFSDFLDFTNLSEELLNVYNYSGIYQIASFHPNYCFENENFSDPANYTNRSPYPMLHLLREQNITTVLKDFSFPEKIPQKNISLTRKLGSKRLLQILKNSLAE